MLGLVIFGWPKREKVAGTTSPGYCENCQNQSMWVHVKTRRWISLFFVPLIPLQRASHWLVCDICGANIEMDKEMARKSKEMIENTEQCANGTLSEEEYYETVEDFASEFRDEPTHEEQVASDVSEAADVRYVQ